MSPTTLNVAVVACDGPVDVESFELERVWLPRLGPTATLAWRCLVAQGTDVWSVNVLARALGVTPRKVLEALARLEMFGVAHLSPQGDVLCVAVASRGLDRPTRRRKVAA